jgi:hypothetical protein
MEGWAANMDNRNSGLIWLLFLAAAIVAVWLFVPLSFSSETTVYTVGINTVDRSYSAVANNIQAVQSQQLVLYWIDGVTPPLKLIDCVVRDAENWTAWYPDDQDSFRCSTENYHSMPQLGVLLRNCKSESTNTGG